jgi:hypothetical protein
MITASAGVLIPMANVVVAARTPSAEAHGFWMRA